MKCKCGSENFSSKNGNYYEEGYLVETVYRCTYCDNTIYVDSYGTRDYYEENIIWEDEE